MKIFEKDVPALFPDGSRDMAHLLGEEEEISGETVAKLTLELRGKSYSGQSERSFFDALVQVRKIFDKEGIAILCFGSCKNVYPSPMQESMGLSVHAYRNVLGRQAGTMDLVEVFDTAPEIELATVEEQKEFHRMWLSSL